MMLLIAAIAALSAGPIAKFENRPPVADYVTTAKLEDVERCLIDIPQGPAPNVYRQPDRPDDVRLIWFKGPEVGGGMVFRLDLHRTATGTHVRSLMPAKQAIDCAPKIP